ncbi:hypothetical protein INT45_012785 [Circinella minor]|uniref:Uncharacterized protein n=1 Tax=Circinella minor TaxID=1195481 RepID=A0A8H7RW15_9FUNG|nr:hypothetical protein INT45_012785 [Circinella minor]
MQIFTTPNYNLSDPLRNPPRRYSATFERNNMGYVWGGEGIHSTESFRDIVPYFNIIDVDDKEHTLSYDFVDNSRDYKKFATGASAVMDPTNDDRVLFFGGYRETQRSISEDVPMYIEQYDFSDSQWTSIPAIVQSQANESRVISPPKNRAFASAMGASDGNIYITGGKLTDTNGTTDSVIIWKYDPIHQLFAPAISQENTTIGAESLKNVHAIMLEDQQILYITGVDQLACLFDPSKNSLVEQKTFGGKELAFKTMSLPYETTFQDISQWLWNEIIDEGHPSILSQSWSVFHIANLYNNTRILMMQDIRLCFQGVLSTNVTALCNRDDGYNSELTTCNEFVNVPMFNRSKHYPYSTYKPPYDLVNCYFLWAGNTYKNIGFPPYNRLQLSYDYTLDNSSLKHTLQIDLYNPYVPNPNVLTYIDSIPDNFPWKETLDQELETEEYIGWSNDEADNRAVGEYNNQYTVDLNGSEPPHLMIDFEYQTRYDLSDTTWNVVGLSPTYEATEEIILDFRTETRNEDLANVSDSFASIIKLQPSNLSWVTLREQRIYTIINVLGSVGGLFALVAAIHSSLYGIRPFSPYGIVQRYSPKNLKVSIQRALYDRFGFLGRPIPLVHPVDQELFYNNESLMQNEHNLAIHSALSGTERNRKTNYGVADDEIVMLPKTTTNSEATVHKETEAAISFQDNTVADKTSRTIIPDTLRLEDELNQLKEMYKDLKNDNQIMCRRQQLLEAMLKAYYLDSEVLQELNNGHDIINNRHNDNDISIDMDSSEQSNTTLQSRVRTALQRPFRRRQLRQQTSDSNNCTTRQTMSVRYTQNSIDGDQMTMTNRSSDDDDKTPFTRDI